VKAEMPTMKTEQQMKADRDAAATNQPKKKAGKRSTEEP